LNKNSRIPVVNDVSVNIKILSPPLKSDYEIIVDENAPAALELVQLPDKPDTILPDAVMQGTTGYLEIPSYG